MKNLPVVIHNECELPTPEYDNTKQRKSYFIDICDKP